MGIKIKSFVFILCFMLTGMLHATPPSSLTITYDYQTRMLHVSVSHQSDKLEKNFIRRIVVYRNGEEDESFYFPRQKVVSGLEEDIPYEAEPGDKIEAEVFCNQGGTAKAETEVPVL